METAGKCAALAVAGALAAMLVRRDSAAFASLVGIAALAAMGVLALELMRPVMAFAESLRERAGLSRGLVAPVVKTMAIGFLSETGGSICEDAGEKTMAGALKLSCGIAAFYVLLPLMQSVLDLMEGLL
jgi:stage III sporulation protein AD